MEKKLRILLMKMIAENGNIANLEKLGYPYPYIAQIYSKLINEGLIIPNENLEYVVSSKGENEVEQLKLEFYKNKKWNIEPFSEYKADKLGKYDIFIE